MDNDAVENPSSQQGETDTKENVKSAIQTNMAVDREEKEELSTSTGSEEGKGNSTGSGSGGYNADCSSSDTSSSNNETATRVAGKQNSANGVQVDKDSSKREKVTNSLKNRDNTVGSKSSGLGQAGGTLKKLPGDNSTSRKHNCSQDQETSNLPNTLQKESDKKSVKQPSVCLAQWNGIRIEHPMDPRIDLSTVGFKIGTAHQAPFRTDKTDKPTPSNATATINADSSNGNIDQNLPSVELYAKLLESVRPFFTAHGIETKSNERSTQIQKESEPVRVATSAINTSVGDLLNTAKNELAAAYASAAKGCQEDDGQDKDSDSMVVLARPKKKHSSKQEGTDSNSGRSASSFEDEAQPQQPERHQQPQELPIQQGLQNEELNEGIAVNQAVMENPLQQHQEQQNMLEDEQRFGISMVSEYSSSARNASGSGSGGNTASGTGSGSNQGGSSGSGLGSSGSGNGSSGSGNDQGGISSNGNGSSGSGNDKGSSEDLAGHNGETNSTENSRDENGEESSSNIKSKISPPDTMNLSSFSASPSDPSQDKDAMREKKLQDKKRKRMNMRRVYEDQMEQDMGSSESSFEQGVLRPGKPVTLENAISFSKTAKLVVKACSSLTVIHANAAYSKLSGIHAHDAVGNGISSIISLPLRELSQLPFEKDDSSPNRETNDTDHNATDSKNHAAAEAAGRARAAASRDDNTIDSLENLIVASGNGTLHDVNVRCKPHKMMELDVKVFQSMVPMKRSQEERSNGSSSITSSYAGPHDVVACKMSINPVISSEVHNYSALINKDHHGKIKRNEKEQDSHQQKAKRRKHHHAASEIMHNRKRHIVSHYVIQLEPNKKDADRQSQSSLSTDEEHRMPDSGEAAKNK